MWIGGCRARIFAVIKYVCFMVSGDLAPSSALFTHLISLGIGYHSVFLVSLIPATIWAFFIWYLVP